jgi:hypothetical protein
MKKRTLASLGLAAALTFSGLAPQAASAYPPGTDFQIAPLSNMIKWRSYTRVVATNTAPGRVTFYVNGQMATYFKPKPVGAAQSWLFWPYRAGKFVITAVSGSESKSTTIYSPEKLSLPVRMSVRRSFPVNLKYVAPGTTVFLSVNGTTIASDVAGSDGLISMSIPAGTLARGINNVSVNYGGVFSSGGKVAGLK